MWKLSKSHDIEEKLILFSHDKWNFTPELCQNGDITASMNPLELVFHVCTVCTTVWVICCMQFSYLTYISEAILSNEYYREGNRVPHTWTPNKYSQSSNTLKEKLHCEQLYLAICSFRQWALSSSVIVSRFLSLYSLFCCRFRIWNLQLIK